MRRYEKYRLSGVEWMERIPSHWESKKLKHLFQEQAGNGFPEEMQGRESGEIPFFKVSDLNKKNIYVETSNNYVSLTEVHENKWNVIPENSILTAKIGEALKKNHRKICKTKCIIDNNCLALCPRKLDVKFAFYLLTLIDFDWFTNPGTVPSVSVEKLRNFNVTYPPLSEQTAIANYLDEKTAQIDKLIANKQRLIDLLNEERTAIINEAVSGKGKNWQRKKLKYVVSKVGSGVTPTGGANVYLQDGIPLLRSQNIFSDRLELIDVAYISEEIDEQMSNSRVQEGDVLLNITGASIGRCCFIPKNFGKGNVNQHVCILRPIQAEIKTEYLHSFLISSYGQILIDICQTGANREGLNFQQIKSFELPVPKIDEQEEIILHIKTETQKIVNTTSKIEKEIGLLQEYRMALISEVVTGKICVV